MYTRIHETNTLNPEVPEKPTRRQFTAAYKLKVLEQADGCKTPGEIGALLRREGLYSSHLSHWRRERRRGALASMSAVSRGRPPAQSAEQREIERLRRDNERLRGQLGKAEKIIDVQKKLSEVLGIALDDTTAKVDR
ncbi:MAG: transposase [Gammaproteobacteria bacterium]